MPLAGDTPTIENRHLYCRCVRHSIWVLRKDWQRHLHEHRKPPTGPRKYCRRCNKDVAKDNWPRHIRTMHMGIVESAESVLDEWATRLEFRLVDGDQSAQLPLRHQPLQSLETMQEETLDTLSDLALMDPAPPQQFQDLSQQFLDLPQQPRELDVEYQAAQPSLDHHLQQTSGEENDNTVLMEWSAGLQFQDSDIGYQAAQLSLDHLPLQTLVADTWVGNENENAAAAPVLRKWSAGQQFQDIGIGYQAAEPPLNHQPLQILQGEAWIDSDYDAAAVILRGWAAGHQLQDLDVGDQAAQPSFDHQPLQSLQTLQADPHVVYDDTILGAIAAPMPSTLCTPVNPNYNRISRSYQLQLSSCLAEWIKKKDNIDATRTVDVICSSTKSRQSCEATGINLEEEQEEEVT